VLSGAIERIAEKHVASNVVAEHYDIVGEQLIGALKEVLGAAATPEIVTAWTEAYQFLANIFIEVEKSKMKKNSDQVGGWEGLRDFIISKKVKEADSICSFHLKPKDNGPIPSYWKAGQYVGIRQAVAIYGEVQRTYSISNSCGDDHIRITVKKEAPEGIEGAVSNTLHSLPEGETVRITMPCGDFIFTPPESEQTPIVLIGLGIGLTPLLPIAKEASKTKNPLYIMLGARNEESLALLDDFKELKRENGEISLETCFKSPVNKKNVGQTMKFEDIWPKLPHNGSYYFCGPASWMEQVNSGLRTNGITDAHFEFFGPTLQI